MKRVSNKSQSPFFTMIEYVIRQNEIDANIANNFVFKDDPNTKIDRNSMATNPRIVVENVSNKESIFIISNINHTPFLKYLLE